MENFWEELFSQNEYLWDFYPSDSALIAKDIFLKNKFKKILIPGIGYGRNAKPFYDSGFDITGIEISRSAIEMARKKDFNFKIHQGSLTEMPFDNDKYDGIFCYSTLHLFNKTERVEILEKCFKQLNKNGLMFFNIVSIDALNDFTGDLIDKNTLKLESGVNVFFYDLESIENEFNKYNILSIEQIDEPIKHMKDQKPLHCYNVICKKV